MEGKKYKWAFLLADIAFPIVGADFLAHYNLSVDLKNRRLCGPAGLKLKLSAPPTAGIYALLGVVAVDNGSTPSLPTVEAPSSSSNSHLRLKQDRPPAAARSGQELVDQYPDVVCSSKRLPAVKHNVVHMLETTCQRPVTARYRRLDAEKLEAARREFADMEDQGIIRKSKGAWSSPLHMVKKTDGSWRPCGDYRLLNLATKNDKYPPPHMEDLSARLAGMKFFSKLDLRKGYYQIPVAAEDIEKTAVITPFGLYEFLRMPFGLKNAGQSFQRLMDEVLRGLPYTFVYLDDILVASRTQEEHMEHLREVLQRLETNGLVINKEKCVFNQRSVDFLGHHVSEEGVRPLQAKVEAIIEFPQPKTRSQLQSFLGMLNFYRRFIRGAAAILKLLTDSTKGGGGKSSKVQWTEEMNQSFDAAKKALAAATQLAHPIPGAEIALAVDASNSHVGAVMQQRRPGGGWQPLGFFSRKLTAAEVKYSTFDRELLACVAALRHFRFMLEGRVFHIQTDHKPLTFALHRLSDPWSACQQRHLAYVAEFTADVRHVAGLDNVVADTMSRPAAAVVPASPTTPVDWADLAAAQNECSETMGLVHSGTLKAVEVQVGAERVWCEESTGVLRPIVPMTHRRRIFDSVHNLAHAGTRATCRLISSRFMWPGLATDTKEWCRQCTNCSRAKSTNLEKTEIKKIEIPANRFSHIHVDLVGPWLPSCANNTHILTMMDRSTRWPESCPIQRTDTETVLGAFISTWVARYGLPAQITTDRGPQFSSATWGEWCRSNGVKHIKTTAYHPQANGMVERLHRQMKNALRAREGRGNWQDHLPWVMLGIRAAPKEESGISSAEAALGMQLKIPGQFLGQPHGQEADQYGGPSVIPATRRVYDGKKQKASPLDSAEWVFIRRGAADRPLVDKNEGPFKVLKRGEKTFMILRGNKEEVVSRDRLSAYKAAGMPQQAALPPRRGRPPGTEGQWMCRWIQGGPCSGSCWNRIKSGNM